MHLVTFNKSRASSFIHRGHTSYVYTALYIKDSAQLAGSNMMTASADGTVKLWDVRTTECLLTIR